MTTIYLIQIPPESKYHICVLHPENRWVVRPLWRLLYTSIKMSHQPGMPRIDIWNGSAKDGSAPSGNPTHVLGKCLDWGYPEFPDTNWNRWIRIVMTFKHLRNLWYPNIYFKKLINDNYKITLNGLYPNIMPLFTSGYNRIVGTPDDDYPGDAEHRLHTHTGVIL